MHLRPRPKKKQYWSTNTNFTIAKPQEGFTVIKLDDYFCPEIYGRNLYLEGNATLTSENSLIEYGNSNKEARHPGKENYDR